MGYSAEIDLLFTLDRDFEYTGLKRQIDEFIF